MNKTDLVNVVADATEKTKKDVDAVVTATLKAIADALKAGDKVLMSRYAGTEVKVDGVEYTILRQSDILAIVE